MRASYPQSAVTVGGIVRVSPWSTMATSGTSCSEKTPVLSGGCASPSMKIAAPLTSEALPLVVGIVLEHADPAQDRHLLRGWLFAQEVLGGPGRAHDVARLPRFDAGREGGHRGEIAVIGFRFQPSRRADGGLTLSGWSYGSNPHRPCGQTESPIPARLQPPPAWGRPPRRRPPAPRRLSSVGSPGSRRPPPAHSASRSRGSPAAA